MTILHSGTYLIAVQKQSNSLNDIERKIVNEGTGSEGPFIHFE